jgi:hypothetical protein
MDPANRSILSLDDSQQQQLQIQQKLRSDETISLFQATKSSVIAALMKDTMLDLFYDSVFDACPICSCNANIRSGELGLYVQGNIPTEN